MRFGFSRSFEEFDGKIFAASADCKPSKRPPGGAWGPLEKCRVHARCQPLPRSEVVGRRVLGNSFIYQGSLLSLFPRESAQGQTRRTRIVSEIVKIADTKREGKWNPLIAKVLRSWACVRFSDPLSPPMTSGGGSPSPWRRRPKDDTGGSQEPLRPSNPHR